jgi:zinc transporter
LSKVQSIETPIQLVVHLVEHLTELFASVVEDRSDAVDDIEDLILKGTFQEQRSELGRVRRLLARLHRQVRANRLALFRLLARLPSWCSDDKADLQQNVERLEGVVQDLELVQERARLLQEEIAGRLEEAVNRNLYVLSTVTTVFLPITLISGIFGMNVGGLPWTQDNFGFGWVVFAMVSTIGVTLLMLQRQKFF